MVRIVLFASVGNITFRYTKVWFDICSQFNSSLGSGAEAQLKGTLSFHHLVSAPIHAQIIQQNTSARAHDVYILQPTAGPSYVSQVYTSSSRLHFITNEFKPGTGVSEFNTSWTPTDDKTNPTKNGWTHSLCNNSVSTPSSLILNK